MSAINQRAGNDLEQDGACHLPPFTSSSISTEVDNVHYRSVEKFDSGINMSLKDADEGFLSTNSLVSTSIAEQLLCFEVTKSVCSDVSNERCNSLAYCSMPDTDSDNVLISRTAVTQTESVEISNLVQNLNDLKVETVSTLATELYNELLEQDEDRDT